MAISREKFEEIRNTIGGHTSWAIWAPQSDERKAKSGVSDLSIFNDENKLKEILPRLNPNIVLAGLNGSTGDGGEMGLVPFANFHSNYSRATDYKIRLTVTATPLEGAFMTDVVKNHFETDSNKLKAELEARPNYKEEKVEEFFSEIIKVSIKPKIFAFGDYGYKIINEYNNNRFEVYKLTHYAATIKVDEMRKHTLNVIEAAGLA